MAEAYFRRLLEENGRSQDICVSSAGLGTFGNDAVSENSVLVMKEIGLDISGHASAPLLREQAKEAAYIICLSRSHYDALVPILGAEKLRLLGQGIDDPFGQDEAVYRRVRDQIIEACDKLYGEIIHDDRTNE